MHTDEALGRMLLQERAGARFIHIPGPNPLLRAGEPGAWDGGVIEACQMLKDHHTYCLYYHGTGRDSGYQIGLAKAHHPLGPFCKYGAAPVLGVGPLGSWDDRSVACAFVIREGAERYLMWYSGMSREGRTWDVGLATAASPHGPWEKHPANPILPGFGYVGGLVVREGRYHLYTEHPIGATGPDYGPISLATAERPEGPYVAAEAPVLQPGGWGEWDDGGFSEAGVLSRSGLLHMFYGGAKLHPTRLQSQESIGYACSRDGTHFLKHPGNPVAPREAVPDAAAFAEVHAHSEPPFTYLYHTLRYQSRPQAEDLGVQVLVEQSPFTLAMPLLEAVLVPGASTELGDCPPLCLASVRECSLTVRATLPGSGLRVEVYGSADGRRYDTVPAAGLEAVWEGAGQETIELPIRWPFARALLVNTGPERLDDLALWATLRG